MHENVGLVNKGCESPDKMALAPLEYRLEKGMPSARGRASFTKTRWVTVSRLNHAPDASKTRGAAILLPPSKGSEPLSLDNFCSYAIDLRRQWQMRFAFFHINNQSRFGGIVITAAN